MTNKNILKVFIILTTAFLFWSAILPFTSSETFIAIKNGEATVTSSQIPDHDNYSWSAQGRERKIHKWLGETIIYLAYKYSGFFGIQLLVGTVFSGFFLISLLIFHRLLKQELFFSLSLAALLSTINFEFFVARVQILIYLLFLITTGILIKYLFYEREKKLLRTSLVWLIPITVLWVNIHISFILIGFFLLGVIISSLILKVNISDELPRSKADRVSSRKFFCEPFILASRCGVFWFKNKIVKELTIIGIGCFLASLISPLSLENYQLIFNYSKNIQIISQFITEWAPMSTEPVKFSIYLTLAIIAMVVAISETIKKLKSQKQELKLKWIITIPLLTFGLISTQAIRHFPLGVTCWFLILVMFFPGNNLIFSRNLRNLILGAVILVSIFWIVLERELVTANSQKFSRQAITFLKQHQLRGNMYNEMSLGSYLIYYLDPQYKVFFDGRAEDVYLCCEMRSFLPLVSYQGNSAAEFKKIIQEFVNKYNFSYLIISSHSRVEPSTAISFYLRKIGINFNSNIFRSSRKYNPNKLMVDFLRDDPNWKQIYSDDQVEILLRNDGKNETIF